MHNTDDDLSWVASYLGRPWSPAGFDCWELLRAVYADRKGAAIPIAGIDASRPLDVARAFAGHSAWGGWSEVEKPRHLDAVLLGQSRYPTHCGVWLAGMPALILHCAQGIGTVVERPRVLERRGWRVLGAYRYDAR